MSDTGTKSSFSTLLVHATMALQSEHLEDKPNLIFMCGTLGLSQRMVFHSAKSFPRDSSEVISKSGPGHIDHLSWRRRHEC